MAQVKLIQNRQDALLNEIEMDYAYVQASSDMVQEATPGKLLVGYHDSLVYLTCKRVMDVLCSTFALIVLSPLMLVVAILIYLDDPSGSPIFIQDRVGKNGKVFRFYKFRSMAVDAEARLKELQDKNEMDGPVFKIKDDPRVTRVGKLIRRTSIDELPQLVNIIKGEMSVVGPRPALPREVEKYGAYEKQRLLVKPGLTCYWQARGRNEIGFDVWMEMDMEYVYEHNIWVDIKLVLITIRMVVTGKGAM